MFICFFIGYKSIRISLQRAFGSESTENETKLIPVKKVRLLDVKDPIGTKNSPAHGQEQVPISVFG